jgi:hypothetical protein
MVCAYSRLKYVLGEQQLTVPELYRRIRQRGMAVNLKSLYRLSRDDHPLERLDLRVAGIICQVCDIPISELIAFETHPGKLRRFPGAKQKRLDSLMARNNEGHLTPAERKELQALVREAEALTLANARVLAAQRRQPAGR